MPRAHCRSWRYTSDSEERRGLEQCLAPELLAEFRRCHSGNLPYEGTEFLTYNMWKNMQPPSDDVTSASIEDEDGDIPNSSLDTLVSV